MDKISIVVAHDQTVRKNKIIVAALVLCCCFTHRRVIKALIRHEPMPKAPKWHVWVKPENRRN